MSQKFAYMLIVLIILTVIVVLYAVIVGPITITEEKAMKEFRLLEPGKELVIEKSSFTWPIIGDPYDVSYYIRVDGRLVSGRCQRNFLGPIMCRLYTGEE